MEKRAKYVYGIIGPDVGGLQVSGMGGEKVYGIRKSGITAVVSDIHFASIDPGDENLLSHEAVIQHIILDLGHSIAPLKFSTILKSRHDVEKLLETGRQAFMENLKRISGKAEFGLKVFIDMEKFKRNAGLDPLKKSHEIALEIFNSMKSMSVSYSLKEQVTDDMIMNCAFLLPKESREVFHSRILELDSKFGEYAIFRPSGPSAPYHFVKMPER